MVRAVSKYSLLSISPPQSQFERHNAVELQPITERRIGPLHRRSSVTLHLFETMIIRFTIDHPDLPPASKFKVVSGTGFFVGGDDHVAIRRMGANTYWRSHAPRRHRPGI